MEAAVKDATVQVRDIVKADPKDILSKVRDAVTGTDPQPVQPAADPRTVSAAAPDAPSPSTSSAFSLQAISDTQGSYTATGASTAAASNLSKAAVETLSAMSMQISKKLEQGNTKFAIELYPADLGKVEVSLHIARDGKTTAHLTFDSPVTAASFSASEPELRQQLANAGLSVDKDALSFSSRDGGNGFGSAMGQDQQQQQSQTRHANRAMEAALKVADDSDLNAALNTAMQAMRNGASKLALNLIV
jgi:flagellar hook-length control protein FliK